MSNLRSALENTMNLQIAEYENGLETHAFSHRFEKRMNKLIKSMGGGSFLLFGSRVPLRKAVQLAFLILILAVLAAVTYAFISWNSFSVKEYDIFSLLNVTDISDAPLTLEERYEIGADLSEYDYEVLVDNNYKINIFYTNLYNKNKTLYFSQWTKNLLENKRINTEDSTLIPAMIEVNGSIGLYMQTSKGEHMLLWDNGSYFIEVIGSMEFSIDELISICNSVQKAE
ncbi:MAG: DUF4367 domain-containing protein [Ruminiclostridium sp.]|nr:DUF4367 domain-containing protein [Ruminiclostridium sp.]